MSDNTPMAFLIGALIMGLLLGIGALFAAAFDRNIQCGDGDWAIVTHEQSETCYRFEDLPLDLRTSLTEKR